MTDFDKLIKEKAEQAEYSYKSSAWRQFQRKSGIGGSTARYWMAGLSSALVIGGIVAFFGYRTNNAEPSAGFSQTVSAQDTIPCQITTSEPENLTAVTYQVPEVEKVTTNIRQVQEKHHTEVVVDTVAKTVRKMTPTVSNPPRYGRPLVIDVDTIKENVPTDEELKNGNSRLY